MKVTVNDGPPFEILDIGTLKIVVDVTGEETLPPTTISITGGKLDVYPHRVTKDNNVIIHMFGDHDEPNR